MPRRTQHDGKAINLKSLSSKVTIILKLQILQMQFESSPLQIATRSTTEFVLTFTLEQNSQVTVEESWFRGGKHSWNWIISAFHEFFFSHLFITQQARSKKKLVKLWWNQINQFHKISWVFFLDFFSFSGPQCIMWNSISRNFL